MPSMKLPSLGLSTTTVSGAAVAAIVAASIGLVAIGVLTYVRGMEPFKTWLVPYTPTAQYGGIFLYSNIIWGMLWVGLFFALRHKREMGSLRIWLAFFIISLGIGTGFAEASLDWSQLGTVMQLGNSNGGPQTMASSDGAVINEVSIKIPEGSSIQGNPSYEPDILTVSKGSTITWTNADTAPHTVTSGAGLDDPQSGRLFDSGSLGQGQKFSISTKDIGEAGKYNYYCVVHPFMNGRIIIQ